MSLSAHGLAVRWTRSITRRLPPAQNRMGLRVFATSTIRNTTLRLYWILTDTMSRLCSVTGPIYQASSAVAGEGA